VARPARFNPKVVSNISGEARVERLACEVGFQRSEQRDTLFVERGRTAAQATIRIGASHGAEHIRDPLLDVEHAQVPFGLNVVEGAAQVVSRGRPARAPGPATSALTTCLAKRGRNPTWGDEQDRRRFFFGSPDSAVHDGLQMPVRFRQRKEAVDARPTHHHGPALEQSQRRCHQTGGDPAGARNRHDVLAL
jgi:hypothetical protein